MTAQRIEHYTTRVQGFYDGKIEFNWAAVDKDGYNNAKNQIFKDLCEDPDAGFVQVEGLSKLLKPSGGLKFRYTGSSTSEQYAPEHGHHDYDHFHHLKAWQGTRFYKFDFEIAVTTRPQERSVL